MKKHLIVICILALCCVVLQTGCTEEENPVSANPSELLGNWSGIYIKLGGDSPDSNIIDVNFTTATNYTLYQTLQAHASSGDAIFRVASEEGTWLQDGNNITFTASLCKKQEPWEIEIQDITCSNPPIVAPFTLTGNQLTISMLEWVNGDTYTYTMDKQ